MSSNLRARKSEQVNYSIRSSGEFRADQGAIWDGITEKADRMAAPSPTGAMAAIYDNGYNDMDRTSHRDNSMSDNGNSTGDLILRTSPTRSAPTSS